MLGLQLISPMLAEGDGVTSRVLAPLLAAAAAASQPEVMVTVSTCIPTGRSCVVYFITTFEMLCAQYQALSVKLK